MDLETFIATTLVEIANGLRRANVDIAASLKDIGRPLTNQHYFALLPKAAAADRTVEFDVAVTATAKGEADIAGKARLFVADATVSGSGEYSHERVSRVRFRVQVEQLVF